VHAIAAREPDKAVTAMRHVIEVGKSRIRASLAIASPNAVGANATEPQQPSDETPAG